MGAGGAIYIAPCSSGRCPRSRWPTLHPRVFSTYEMAANRFKRPAHHADRSPNSGRIALPQIHVPAPGNPVVYDPAHRQRCPCRPSGWSCPRRWATVPQRRPLRRLLSRRGKKTIASCHNALKQIFRHRYRVARFNVFGRFVPAKAKAAIGVPERNARAATRCTIMAKKRRLRQKTGCACPSDVDALGMPRVAIDFDYSAADADGRAERRTRSSPKLVAEAASARSTFIRAGRCDAPLPIVSQARTACTASGTTRMSTDPEAWRGTPNCRVQTACKKPLRRLGPR